MLDTSTEMLSQPKISNITTDFFYLTGLVSVHFIGSYDEDNIG